MAEAGALYINYHDPTMFGADVWANVTQGREIMGHEYVNAQRLRGLYRKQFDQLWQIVDVLVSPTTAITAPLLTETTVQIDGQAEGRAAGVYSPGPRLEFPGRTGDVHPVWKRFAGAAGWITTGKQTVLVIRGCCRLRKPWSGRSCSYKRTTKWDDI